MLLNEKLSIQQDDNDKNTIYTNFYQSYNEFFVTKDVYPTIIEQVTQVTNAVTQMT